MLRSCNTASEEQVWVSNSYRTAVQLLLYLSSFCHSPLKSDPEVTAIFQFPCISMAPFRETAVVSILSLHWTVQLQGLCSESGTSCFPSLATPERSCLSPNASLTPLDTATAIQFSMLGSSAFLSANDMRVAPATRIANYISLKRWGRRL